MIKSLSNPQENAEIVVAFAHYFCDLNLSNDPMQTLRAIEGFVEVMIQKKEAAHGKGS